MTVTFLVVEKAGTLKEVDVKTITSDELYKKCGFRKSDGFESRVTWENVKLGHQKYTIQLWARDEGKSDTQNKYVFPSHVDSKSYFGNCALIQLDSDENIISLSKEVWLKISEKLLRGTDEVRDIHDVNDEDDDDEIDDLETIKTSSKTKTKSVNYLKDGFTAENSGDDDEDSDGESDKEEDETDNEETETEDVCKSEYNDEDGLDEINGSELEEEDYDYDD